MKTKKPRVVRVSHPQLLRFRTAMRLILRAAIEQKLKELRGERSIVESDSSLPDMERISKKKEIMREISYYSHMQDRYPVGCGFCGDRAVGEDLIYNPALNEWYCEEHYAEFQEYYKKNPSSEGYSWKELYPPLPSKK